MAETNLHELINNLIDAGLDPQPEADGVFVRGEKGNSSLIGTDAGDVLEAQSKGKKTLAGGRGDDIYLADGAYTIVEEDDGGQDMLVTRESTSIFTLPENVEVLLSLGANNSIKRISGNDGDNILIIEPTITDELDAKGGDDIIYMSNIGGLIKGGEGQDTFVLDGRQDDYMVEDIGNGQILLTENETQASVTLEGIEHIVFREDPVDGRSCRRYDGRSCRRYDGRSCRRYDGRSCRRYDGRSCRRYDGRSCRRYDGRSCRRYDGRSCRRYDGRSCRRYDGRSCRRYDGRSCRRYDGRSCRRYDGRSCRRYDGRSCRRYDGRSCRRYDGRSCRRYDGRSCRRYDGRSCRRYDGRSCRRYDGRSCRQHDGRSYWRDTVPSESH